MSCAMFVILVIVTQMTLSGTCIPKALTMLTNAEKSGVVSHCSESAKIRSDHPDSQRVYTAGSYLLLKLRVRPVATSCDDCDLKKPRNEAEA